MRRAIVLFLDDPEIRGGADLINLAHGTVRSQAVRSNDVVRMGALIDALIAAGVEVAGVGEVDDLFRDGVPSHSSPLSNAERVRRVQEWIQGPRNGFLVANLVDFDQLYEHRNDVAGLDLALPEAEAASPAFPLREDDLLFITAGHRNDPSRASSDVPTDVPLLVMGPRVHPGELAPRDTFADVEATVAEWLDVPFRGAGTSFLGAVVR